MLRLITYISVLTYLVKYCDARKASVRLHDACLAVAIVHVNKNLPEIGTSFFSRLILVALPMMLPHCLFKQVLLRIENV